jgi:hypothetical protein
VLAETREQQKFREHSQGISAVSLAIGEKVTKVEEATGDWSLEKGGIVPRSMLIQDRDRDRYLLSCFREGRGRVVEKLDGFQIWIS